jgi:hypothetical protein
MLGVLFAPLTMLLKVDFALNLLLVFATPVIDAFALLTGQFN